jgi:hypothetical protein
VSGAKRPSSNPIAKIASTISDVGEFAATKPQQTFGRKVTKALPYVAALVFVAGGIAFLIAYFGNTSNVTHPNTARGPGIDASKNPPTVPVPQGAKTVAADYVTSTMTRQNLALSWTLTHPKLKAGYTRKEWLSGNIPVPVFPASAFAGATYKVQWSRANDVMLNVYVFAKPKMARLSNAFFIELNPVGTGASKRWLVSYVAPSGGGQDVPAQVGGG